MPISHKAVSMADYVANKPSFTENFANSAAHVMESRPLT